MTLHLLAAVLWVGGMLVMLLAVRPSAVAVLEPPLRLAFMAQVLGRFFGWVWLVVAALPLSGYGLVFILYGSLQQAPHHVQAMQWLGWLMIAIFVALQWPYRRLQAALAAGEPPRGAAALERIRQGVTLNAVLGVTLSVIAVAGRYWI